MKITGIKTTLYEHDMPRRMGDANSPAGRVRAAGLAVEVETDEGLTGAAVGSSAARGQIHGFEPLLIGQDPRRVRGLWKRLVDKVFKGGHDGIANDAISALDVAMWDLKAKAYGEPLWRLLGAAEPRVKGYASGIEIPLSDDEVFEFYSTRADMGFTGGKLKVGLDQDADIRRIGLMEKALKKTGPRPQLMIDANEYWSPKQAIRKVREMEETFDLFWVEEPARRWDYIGLRKVSQGIRAAVTAGENLDTIGQFMPYIAHGSADIIQVGSGMTGITGALQIADMAYGFELPITISGGDGLFMAHVAAAMPHHTMLEAINIEPSPVTTSDTRIEDGWVVIGDKPGTGLEFDQEQLRLHAVERVSAVAGPSPFGRRPGAGLYPVPPTPEEIAEARSS